MEFHEKIQELRKQRGLTQEELAESLYVSRTAVSKWESGRGYPNIDSLKALARYFGVTIDELLSGEELVTLAEENTKQKENHIRDLVFGWLDISAVLLLFLPLFGRETDGVVQAVSLLSLTGTAAYLRVAYFATVAVMMLVGVLTLTLQNCQKSLWVRWGKKLSPVITGLGTLLFIISQQPYAATLLFVFLVIQALMLIKWP